MSNQHILDTEHYEKTTHHPTLLAGCTVYWSRPHQTRINHWVVIVCRDECPFPEKPWAVLNHNCNSFYHGSYDLTMEEALEERERRTHKR